MNYLPKGWAKVRLKDVVQPRGEKANPQDFPDLTFLGMDDVEPQTTRIVGGKSAKELKSSAARFCDSDVLYGRLRPYLNKVTLPKFHGLASAEFIVFPDTEQFDSRFLMHRLNARDFVSFASHLNEGDRPRVNFDQIGEFDVLLPPPAEQRRIIAKIEELFSELDKGIEAFKTAQAQLKVYRQALLKHAFEGKLTADWREANKDKLETADQLLARIKAEREVRYEQQLEAWKQAVVEWELAGKEGKKPAKPRAFKENDTTLATNIEFPSEWRALPLGSLNVEVFDGPFGSNLKSKDYVEEGVRVVRLENIGVLRFVEEKQSFVSEVKYTQLKKHTVRYGDLVFSSFITEGIRVAPIPKSIERAINKADCFCIRPYSDTVRKDFLAFFLSSRPAYKQIEDQVHGVGRPRINTSQLKGFLVPICSVKEQDVLLEQLSEKMSIADQLDADLTAQLEAVEALRQSILKKAFSGQLVPQDPSDEPASKLLERIKAEKAKAAALKKPKRKKAS